MGQQQKDRSTPLGIFISSDPRDEALRDELIKHLENLRHQRQMVIWHQGQIPAGINPAEMINEWLERASVILLLISVDFIASQSCQMEMSYALQRRQTHQVQVIPILLRSVDLQDTPIASLRPLPLNGQPIMTWGDRDTVWKTVAEDIRRTIENPSSPPVSTSASSLFPIVRNIPYEHNLFFTGREDVLDQLHTQFRAGQSMAHVSPLALCGLGGIGKTRIAVEYAYTYHQNYQYVLWAQAESREALTSSYLHLASLLKLPVQDALSTTIVVDAIKCWLQDHSQWLLILDNADDLTLVRDFLPSVTSGHVLLTTQAHAMGGLAHRIEVKILSLEQGALFLLRRAGLLAPDAAFSQSSIEDRTLARQITQQLGGLPLALDQAGAYIEETGCSLSDYLQIYQQRRVDLLKERCGLMIDHPKPIATTLSLSFEKVEQSSPAAADLLRLHAFFDPDALPLEIVAGRAADLGPRIALVANDPYLLDQAIRALRAYSLVSRDPVMRTLSVHRLVQAVVQDTMTDEARKQWKERAVNAVSATFPSVEFAHWAECERWLPHALVCCNWIKQERMLFPLAARLLTQTGCYLRERALYAQAESLFQQALTIDEQIYGPEHLQRATDLNHLGCLYWSQGRYEETEPLFLHALEIRRQQLEHGHPDTAETFNNLACLYQTRGKYKEAESLFQQALVIDKQVYGPEGPAVAIDQSNLAEVYRRLGKYKEADLLLKHALSIHERHSGPEHLNTAQILHKQALLSYDQGRSNEAESLFERTLKIYETYLGEEHPHRVQILHGLAEVYRVQGKYEEAEELFQVSLAIMESKLGPEHSATAAILNSLALLYLKYGKYIYVKQEGCMKQCGYEEAEKLLQRALEIREQKLGPEHHDTALILHNLALLYLTQGMHEKAKNLFQRALSIWKQQLGDEHPYIVHALHHLLDLRT